MPRRFPQQSQRVPDVLHCLLHEGKSALFAIGLTRRRHAAKRGHRLPPRLVRRHAGADVVVDVCVEMTVQLVDQFRVA